MWPEMWPDELNDLLIGDEYVDEYGEDMSTKDGCPVEPDGHCPHGYASPFLRLGFI